MARSLRILTGLLVWTAAGGAIWWCVDRQLASSSDLRDRVAPELWQYAAGARREAVLEIEEPVTVAVGDPVFVVDGPDAIRQIGEITAVRDDRNQPVRRARVTAADALFYPGAPELNGDFTLVYYNTSDADSMEWVLQTMLPPEKREQLALLVADAIEAHREEIIRELRPIVEASLRDASRVVEYDLRVAIRKRQPELERLGERYQRDLVRKDVVPLVRQEIWPIVRKRAEPVANEVGLKIWQRLPVWSFTWRYFADAAPLKRDDYVEKEWRRFLKSEAFPILERHTDDFVAVVQTSIAEASRHPEVQAAARRNFRAIIEDPDLHAIVMDILREVFVDNPRLEAVFARHWNSTEARQAFQVTAERLQPTVREIGDVLFGTREDGISPEFARVLRNQILHKDKRWFVLERDNTFGRNGKQDGRENLPVRRGMGFPINPFVPETPPAAERIE